MQPDILRDLSEVWDYAASAPAPQQFHLELEIKEKLLNIFHPGDFYYYIFNIQTHAFELVSKDVNKVMGYTPEEYDIPTFLSAIHPEDQPWFVEFESVIVEFFTKLPPDQIPDYKIRTDFRIRKKNGEYIRLLQQLLTIDYDGKGSFFRTLGIHTDITHLKAEGRPVISFIGLNDRPSFLDAANGRIATTEKIPSTLSKREQQVLTLLADGRTSREIGEQLHISRETVETHRKNLLAKMQASNTAELIRKGVREGWI